MSYLYIKAPQNITKLLSQIQVPGTPVPQNEMHITLLYLSKETSIQDLSQMLPSIYEKLKDFKPFEVSMDKVDFFPKGEDGYPVFAKVKSKDCNNLHNSLKEALNQADIEYDDTYPDFNCHLTLSYSEEKPKSFKIPNISFMVSEIELFAGAYQKSGVTIQFPLSHNVKRAEELATQADWMKKIAESDL